VIAEERDLVD